MGRQTVTYLPALHSEAHPSAETFCGMLKIDMEKTLQPSETGKAEEMCATPCSFTRACILCTSELSCEPKLNSV